MSTTKPKINIERALRELNLQVSQRYQPVECPLSEISSNLPSSLLSSKELSRKNSKDYSQAVQRSSKKINNKENCCDPIKPEIQQKSNTYVAISKALQQKTQLIGQQKHQIQVLRQCVEDVKNNKQVKSTQEIKMKPQELSILKEREKEYLQGLTEILGLKQNLQDIKRKYNQLTSERNSLQQQRNCLITQRNSLLAQRNILTVRFDSLFAQSQELTISITHLKIQKQQREAAFRKMQDQMACLKEKLKMKTAAQQRAINLQRRLSECMQKLGQTQQELNSCQMKYYRLQQDADLIKQDGQQRLASALRQCRTQREQHQQEITKMTILLRQAEKQRRQLAKQHQNEKQFHLRAQIKSLKQELITVTEQLNSVTQEKQLKNQQLLNQNQRTIIHFSALLQEKEEQIKKIRSLLVQSEEQLQSLRHNAQINRKQYAQILMKIQALQRSLTEENQRLTQINASLQAQNDKISAELSTINSERTCLIDQRNILRQQLSVFRENEQKDIKYYRQKYEHQLSQYNSLSQYSHSVELQHAFLLNSQTSLLIQCSNLKAQLSQLQNENIKFTSSLTEITKLNEQIKQLKDEIATQSGDFALVRAQAGRWKLQFINLQTEMGRMQLQIRREQQMSKQWQKRAQQRQNALRQVRAQVSQQVQQINFLKSSIMAVQQSYSSLLQQHNAQLFEWERRSQAAKVQNSQLQNSRISAQYELDNSQATISILKQQNSELHRIFSSELQRRNSIIRQLMAQKRALYQQLVGREGDQ